jgi:tetratricopeptide (TPR) repeat protein
MAQVCTEDPKHDYGHSLMALAETQGALGELENAVATWQRVLQKHSYARARVQLAELYQATREPERAAAELHEVLADDAHAPAFQRKRDHIWVRRAKALLRRLK